MREEPKTNCATYCRRCLCSKYYVAEDCECDCHQKGGDKDGGAEELKAA